MWYLTSEGDKIIYVVPQKKEITIGRSPDQSICDFAIQDDPSISRKHAVLTNLENSLYIKDLGSRYGTFANNSKVENTNKKLKETDVVKFGKMGSIWKVHEGNFVTCTSTLKGENLITLQQILAKIGGVLKGDWDDTCKYLTMPAITLTIKVVLALVQGSHIVTTQFWNECLTAITNNELLPDPKSYTPEIVESTLNKDAVSFLPNSRRGKLFAGKKFIFFSRRQYDMYKPVLLKGSATPMLLSESKFSKSMLSDDDMVVIQYNIISTSQETEAQRSQISEILNYLKGKGKRVIADAEIGLAILYVSTEKYCNPGFNFTSEVVRQATAPASHNKVLAQDTQEKTPSKKDNVIINESLVSTNDENSSKRKLSDDEMETNANKKIATNASKASPENAKRKYDDEGSCNPNKKMAIDTSDDDLFNFITPGSNDISNKTKSADKLHLAKPQKRKAGLDSSEDDLFNFVQNEENDASRKMFEEQEVSAKKHKLDNMADDITAMRGSKLEELNKINQNWNANVIKPNNIKKEADDLDEKLNLLNIGSVVVTIKENLIIKKEPIEIEDQSNSVKNFKKFKKVWPIKMQVTVIPKSSMSVVKPYDNSHEASVNALPPNNISEEATMNAMVSNDISEESSLTY